MLKESYYYNSPFYKYYCHFCMFKDHVKDTRSKNPPLYTYFIGFLKEYRKFDDRLRGIYYSSDDILVLKKKMKKKVINLWVIIKNKYLRFYVKYIIKQ